MFCRRFSPMMPDMFDMSFMPRQRRQAFMAPKDVFAVLSPLGEQQRCGGKMCRRKSRKMEGRITKPKTIERRPAMKDMARKFTFAEEPWETSVQAEAFKPSDFMIFLQGRTIIIHGVRSEGDEDSGIVKTEFRRKIAIPNDVILPTLSVDFKDGNVVLSGRCRVIKKNAETDKETTEEKIVHMAEKDDAHDHTVEVPVNKASEETNDETPASVGDDEKKSDSAGNGMNTSTCPCEETTDCANSDCPQKNDASVDEVIMEDLGPEEEEDGVIRSDVEEDLSSQTTEEVKSHTSEVTEKEMVKAQSSEVREKTNSDICEYEPVTWSIPLRDFDTSDVSVRLEGDTVRVVAEHEEENDGMTFFRRTERSFALPRNVNPDTLTSRFCTDDGKLTIKVMPCKTTQQKSDGTRKGQIKDKESGETSELKKDENGWTILPINFE